MDAIFRKSVGIGIAIAAIGAGLTGAFGSLGLQTPEQIALSILIVAAAMWITEAVPLFVTSLAVLALALVWLMPGLERAEIEAAASDFTSPFFSDVILLFLGGFTLSAALRKHRFDERLARGVIRATGGEMPKLIAGVMGITALLSMWLSNTATAAMMLAICLPLVQRLPEGHTGRLALILSIPLAANIGGLGTPIGTPPNAIAVRYLQQRGEPIDFGTWMMAGVPGVIVLLALAWCLLMYAGRKQRDTKFTLDDSPPPKAKGWKPTLVLVMTGVTIFGWITGGWHGLSAGTVSLAPIIVLFGVGVLDSSDLRSMSWDVLLLMGGGLCLGEVMERSGLAATIVEVLPLEGAPAGIVLAIVCITATLMSTVMSNTASATLLLPLVMGLGALDPSPLGLGVAMSCSLAMALPISTPPNAIAFSSGEIRSKHLIIYGGTIAVAGLTLLLLVGPWWWSVVGV